MDAGASGDDGMHAEDDAGVAAATQQKTRNAVRCGWRLRRRCVFAAETKPDSTFRNFRAEVLVVLRVFALVRLTLFCGNVCWGET
jgi:hypothetical protein